MCSIGAPIAICYCVWIVYVYRVLKCYLGMCNTSISIWLIMYLSVEIPLSKSSIKIIHYVKGYLIIGLPKIDLVIIYYVCNSLSTTSWSIFVNFICKNYLKANIKLSFYYFSAGTHLSMPSAAQPRLWSHIHSVCVFVCTYMYLWYIGVFACFSVSHGPKSN